MVPFFNEIRAINVGIDGRFGKNIVLRIFIVINNDDGGRPCGTIA